jgi:hypothetical protein
MMNEVLEDASAIGYEEIGRRAQDVRETIGGFDMNLGWEGLLDKYRLLVAQFNKVEEGMKEETKMVTVFPKDVDWETHPPDWSMFHLVYLTS